MYFAFLILLIISISFITLRYTKRSIYILDLVWIILFILIGTYGYFTDDYEPYEKIVLKAYIDPLATFHIEPLWIWIANMTKGDVTKFRLIAFVSIAIMLLCLSKVTNTKLHNLLAFYSLICVSSHFCWVRQPLAMIFFAIGFILLTRNNILASIPCFVATVFIHKVGLIMILLIPFIFLKINKRNLIIIVLSIPFFSTLLYSLSLFSDYNIITIFNEYSKADGSFDGRNIIYTIINALSFWSNIILLAYTIYRYKDKVLGYYTKVLRYLFGLTCLAIILLFMPIQVDVMITRILSIANLFLVIILSKYLNTSVLGKEHLPIIINILFMRALGELGLLANNYTRISRLTKPLF